MLSLPVLSLMLAPALAHHGDNSDPSRWSASVLSAAGHGEAHVERDGDAMMIKVTADAPLAAVFVRLTDDSAPVLVVPARGSAATAISARIHADDLSGALSNEAIADLAHALNHGTAVVSVHLADPDAPALRGPLVAADRVQALAD